jgi:predicted ribosome quality control (RQC) complex YloA/Tae2 family protein
MSFDGIMTRAVTHEVKMQLLNGKITKVYQPYPTDLLLVVRAQGQAHKLFLSANSSFPRFHLTTESYDNPQTPPMFCMLLRKHLEGSIIESIEQLEMERLLEITVKARNEIGDITFKKIIVEIMGRHSNISIIDKDSNVIIDCIKHIPPSLNRHRSLLPGQHYIAPPSQEKLNPLNVDRDGFLKRIDFNAGKLDGQIVGSFEGVSPLIAKEVVHRSGLSNRDSLSEAFLSIMDRVEKNEYTPQMIVTQQKEFFTVIELTHVKGDKKTYQTVSELLDRYFFGKAERDRIKQQAHDLERFLRTEHKKNKKKIVKLKQALIDAEKAEQHKLFGELLTAHIYLIQRGDNEVEVTNYYDADEGKVTIPLDPQKAPAENAQHYFKLYSKLKNSVLFVQEQIEKTEEEMIYLDNLIQQMESAFSRDVAEIREELEEEGYLKRKVTKQRKKKQQLKPTIEQYRSSDGVDIYVGKNNKQNDYLSNKLARSNDIWLHTKDIPGSHVVIKATDPSETTLLEAANLAAYFSKAKTSSSVPVDFTEIRHVKKPSGAKPGFVIYDHQQTIYVTPDEDLVFSLRG